MGFLNAFKSRPGALLKLSTGSFTVDRDGVVIVSTLPRAFPEHIVRDIAQQVLAAFRGAREAHQPLAEVIADYPALRVTARELRGGAIIFLAPASGDRLLHF